MSVIDPTVVPTMHPSVLKKCLPVIQQALGVEWVFCKQLLVPTLGLEFRHRNSSWPIHILWDGARFVSSSLDLWVHERDRLQASLAEATAAATALVKLRAWGTLADES